MRVAIDQRAGVHCEELTYDAVNPQQIVDIIDRLDGSKHTLVSLDRGDGWQMCIGGGAVSFIVTRSSEDDQNFTLPNEDGTLEKEVELCVGGQYAEFSESIVVNKDLACQAMILFFDRKENELTWLLE